MARFVQTGEASCSQCKVCQAAKLENVSSPGLLQPLPIPEDVWIDIPMNFINGLQNSGEKNRDFSCRR